MQSDIRKAVDDCQGYAKQYEQMKKRVEANQLAYDVMRRKYEEGLVSPARFADERQPAAVGQGRPTENETRLHHPVPFGKILQGNSPDRAIAIANRT